MKMQKLWIAQVFFFFLMCVWSCCCSLLTGETESNHFVPVKFLLNDPKAPWKLWWLSASDGEGRNNCSSFCFFILFFLCVSHVVICGCSHFGNPTLCSLHVNHCCTVASSPQGIHFIKLSSPLSSDVRGQNKMWGQLKTRVLWYKLFCFPSVKLRRDFCCGYDCKSLCCPLVEQRPAVRFLHESVLFGVHKDVYLELGRVVYSCHQMNKHQRGGKKDEFLQIWQTLKHRNCNVGNQLAGWCLFFVSFRS